MTKNGHNMSYILSTIKKYFNFNDIYDKKRRRKG